jgi:hypothetical protein
MQGTLWGLLQNLINIVVKQKIVTKLQDKNFVRLSSGEISVTKKKCLSNPYPVFFSNEQMCQNLKWGKLRLFNLNMLIN